MHHLLVLTHFSELVSCYPFQELSALLEEGVYDMERFLEGGWVTGLKYEDEVLADLKLRIGCKEEEVSKTYQNLS